MWYKVLQVVEMFVVQKDYNYARKMYPDMMIHKLSVEQQQMIVEKIVLLPVEWQNILILHYVLEEEFPVINNMLELSDSESELYYIENFLASSLQMKGQRISRADLAYACEIVQRRELKELECENKKRVNYNVDIKRRLRKLSINIHYGDRKLYMLKRIVACLVLVVLGLASIPSVRAKAWESLKEWTITFFDEYSIFQSPDSITSVSKSELLRISVGYIPQGFQLWQEVQTDDSQMYIYTNQSGNILVVDLSLSSPNASSVMNTEGVTISQVVYRDVVAYVWENGEEAFLIWSKDGIDYNIYGYADVDEVWKIANSIK